MQTVLDKLQIFVSIIVSLVVVVVSMLQGVTLQVLATRLIIGIIVFYLVGLVARAYLKRYVFAPVPAKDDTLEEADKL